MNDKSQLWYAAVWTRLELGHEWRGNIFSTLAAALEDKDRQQTRDKNLILVRMISVKRTTNGDIECGTIRHASGSSGRSGGGRYSDD